MISSALRQLQILQRPRAGTLRTQLSLALVALALVGGGAAVKAYETQPAAGTLTETTTRLEFAGGGLLAPNVTGLCVTGTEDCDVYLLDVNLPADYAATHPNAKIRITVGWPNPSTDYDVYLVKRPEFTPSMTPPPPPIPRSSRSPLRAATTSGRSTSSASCPSARRTPPRWSWSARPRRRSTPTATAYRMPSTSARARRPGPRSMPWDVRWTYGDRFCEVPGKEVATDSNAISAGDAVNNGGVGVYDVEWLKVSTPKSADNPRQLAFTIKLKSLSPQPPPNARYLAFFTGADGIVYFAGMTTFPDENGGQPVFRYGTGTSAFDDLGFGAAGSSYNADGTITVVVPAARLGAAVAPGGALTGFRVGARLSPGAVNAGYLNGADLDEATSVADYQIPNMGACGDTEGGDDDGPVTVGGPTFSLHVSPAGIADSAAEPTLDVNTRTGSIFYIAYTEVDRVRFDDSVSPARDTWEDKTGTLTGLRTSDPILVADRDTGRIFASQLVLGLGNSIQEYSDDDGNSWLPSLGGSQRRARPPGARRWTLPGRIDDHAHLPERRLLLLAGRLCRLLLAQRQRRRHVRRQRARLLAAAVRRPARPPEGRPRRHRLPAEQGLHRRPVADRLRGCRPELVHPGRSRTPARAGGTRRWASPPTARCTSATWSRATTSR